MIKKLKSKFILLATLSLFILLTCVVAGMCILNYFSLTNELDGVLALLSENKGSFPVFDKEKTTKLPEGFSPELPYQSRYFSVILNNDGTVKRVDTSRIAAINESTAETYAVKIYQKGSDKGFINGYRYVRTNETNSSRIIFLDASRQLDSLKVFCISAVLMSSIGMIAVFIAIIIYSGRIIRPVAESYEKQKRFITDAGHELKTPLTIINANTDLLEMEYGANESTDEIHRQTKRLTELTNNLVYLSKMEESKNAPQMIEIPISDVVKDAVQAFKAPALAQNKRFSYNIQPMLSIIGNGDAITELVSILLDNAMKYSENDGIIDLRLVKQNKTVYLTVFNTTSTELPKEGLHLLFERFYRADSSRNSQSGGHGLGLSIAQAIVKAHGGKLQAVTNDGFSLLITVLFNA